MAQRVQLQRTMGLFRLVTALAVTSFIAITLFQTTRIHAQALGTGSISGSVEDSSGAVVSGASVTATNTGTNLKTTEKTSGSGTYTLPNLPAGDYTLKYRVRAALGGIFRVGPATVQSMYAPEFTAYSAGNVVRVGAAP